MLSLKRPWESRFQHFHGLYVNTITHCPPRRGKMGWSMKETFSSVSGIPDPLDKLFSHMVGVVVPELHRRVLHEVG